MRLLVLQDKTINVVAACGDQNFLEKYKRMIEDFDFFTVLS